VVLNHNYRPRHNCLARGGLDPIPGIQDHGVRDARGEKLHLTVKENTASNEQRLHSAGVTRSVPRRIWLGLGGGFALIFLAVLPPGIYSIDGNAMLAVAESVVAHHRVTVPPELGMPGRGGQYFSVWYPLQSFLAVPFVAAGNVTAHLLRLPEHYVAAIFALLLPVVFTAATLALVAMIALELGSLVPGAYLAASCYGVGTIAMVYARTFYADPLFAFLTAASIYLAIRGGRREIFSAGVCAALVILAKPTGIIVGPIVSFYLMLKHKKLRKSFIPAAGAALGFAVYCLYNQIRFGNPFLFSRPTTPHLSTIPVAILGQLLSPGRGLLWYSPVVVAAFAAALKGRRTHLSEVLLIGATFLGFLLEHSIWDFWAGGWSWGPRYLLAALPALMAFLGLLSGRWRRLAIALTIAGFLINAATLFTFYERYYAEANEQGVSEHDLEWSMRNAPFLHSWPAAIRQVRDARQVDVKELFIQRDTSPARTISSSRALRIVALWWWVLPIAHIPRVVGAAISLLVMAGGCWMIVRQFRAACAILPSDSTYSSQSAVTACGIAPLR
jgi:hypothetical protein